jgi:hypothetical protein
MGQDEHPIDRAERGQYPYDHLHSPLEHDVDAKGATLRREATGPAAAAEYLDDEASHYDLD